jgi:GLPGLI family protein
MKKTLLFVLFFSIQTLFVVSQTLNGNKIRYSYFVNSKINNYELVVLDTISCFVFFKSEDDLLKQQTANINISSEFQFYKNLVKDKIYYIDGLFSQKVPVIDSLDTMKWKMQHEKKNILGYECSSAKTVFRGHQYTAYFSTAIPIVNGPWKFGGLPGLILSVESEDGNYRYLATSISLNQRFDTENYKKSYSNFVYGKRKLETWSNFSVSTYKTMVDNLVKRLKSGEKEGNGFPEYLKINRPEMIYKEAQTGNGIEY